MVQTSASSSAPTAMRACCGYPVDDHARQQDAADNAEQEAGQRGVGLIEAQAVQVDQRGDAERAQTAGDHAVSDEESEKQQHRRRQEKPNAGPSRRCAHIAVVRIGRGRALQAASAQQHDRPDQQP
jgi:hypothetical protein